MFGTTPLLTACFVGGMFIQALLLLPNRLRRLPKTWLVLSLLLSSAFLLYGVFILYGFRERFQIGSFFVSMCLFPLLVCAFFRDDFLPDVNPQIVFSIAITFAYAIAEGFGYWFLKDSVTVFLVLLLPISIGIGALDAGFSWTAVARLVLYLLYLIMVALIAALQLHRLNAGLLLDLGHHPLTRFHAFLWGMGFAFVGAHAAVFALLLKGGEDSFEYRQRTGALLQSLLGRMEALCAPTPVAVSLLAAQTAFLLTNLEWKLAAPENALLGCLVVFPTAFIQYRPDVVVHVVDVGSG